MHWTVYITNPTLGIYPPLLVITLTQQYVFLSLHCQDFGKQLSRVGLFTSDDLSII